MTYRISLALLTALACASGAAAQHPTAAAASKVGAVADSAVRKFAGVWEGMYTSDHAPGGGMRVQIARDSVWSVSMSVFADQTIQSNGTNIRIDADHAAWSQEVMGMTCETSTQLDAGVLKGQISCEHGKIGFELRRRTQ